jgi:hypothetical protein
MLLLDKRSFDSRDRTCQNAVHHDWKGDCDLPWAGLELYLRRVVETTTTRCEDRQRSKPVVRAQSNMKSEEVMWPSRAYADIQIHNKGAALMQDNESLYR